MGVRSRAKDPGEIKDVHQACMIEDASGKLRSREEQKELELREKLRKRSSANTNPS
jgi:hypothetical protein